MTNKAKIKVIGIDPAPGKGSLLFDGEQYSSHLKPDELKNELAKSDPVLICWDAPLTGPGVFNNGRFTQRPIEKYLREQLGLNKKLKNNKAQGVSVQGYAGCQHWTISRYIFGFPRL